jgi:hypothetical protein
MLTFLNTLLLGMAHPPIQPLRGLVKQGLTLKPLKLVPIDADMWVERVWKCYLQKLGMDVSQIEVISSPLDQHCTRPRAGTYMMKNYYTLPGPPPDSSPMEKWVNDIIAGVIPSDSELNLGMLYHLYPKEWPVTLYGCEAPTHLRTTEALQRLEVWRHSKNQGGP